MKISNWIRGALMGLIMGAGAHSASAGVLFPASEIALTENVNGSTTPAYDSTLIGLVNDPFSYDPLSPLSPLPVVAWSASTAFHADEPEGTDVVLSFTLSAGMHTTALTEPVIVIDVWGRSGYTQNDSVGQRDDNFDVHLLNGESIIASVTGLGIDHDLPGVHARAAFDSLPVGTEFNGVRIVGHDSTSGQNNYFTLSEIRAASLGSSMPCDLTISISAPLDGGFVTNGVDAVFSASISNETAERPAALVEFYIDGELWTNDSEAPFEAILSNLAVGAHKLNAIVYDSAGRFACSDTVAITALPTDGNTPPKLELVTPDGPVDSASSVALQVRVDDEQGDDVQVQFYGRRLAPVNQDDFAIIAIPDTQHYVIKQYGSNQDMFNSQIDWIVAERENRNIAFVTHLGDIVQDNDSQEAQWQLAAEAMYRLENPEATGLVHGIPYGLAMGNHDGHTTGKYFNQYFGTEHFYGKPYYGGTRDEGVADNNYQLFTAGGYNWIGIHINCYDSSTATLDWIEAVLAAHPDRYAFIETHTMINTYANFHGQGAAIYDRVKGNPQVIFMIGGHHKCAPKKRSDTYEGHTIHSFMYDFQGHESEGGYPGGGQGRTPILTFSPSTGKLNTEVYSPYLGEYDDHAFELDIAFALGTEYVLLGTTNVAAGSVAALEWNGLKDAHDFEWYVVASDADFSTTSDTGAFSTATALKTPEVALRNIRNGDRFEIQNSIDLEAIAADEDGDVEYVEFYINGEKIGQADKDTYAFSWNAPSNGTYTVSAKATDNDGLSTFTTPIRIEVIPTQVAPTVVLTAPAGGATVSGGVVEFTADAADEDGDVVSVEFYNGPVKLGESTEEPYVFTWSDVFPGEYTFTAKAIDNMGNEGVSSAVTFSVGEAELPDVYPHYSVPVLQDSYVHEGNSNNFGADEQIRIKLSANNNHERVGYLEFDLSAFAGETITGASLSMQLSTGSAGSTFLLDLHGVHPTNYVAWNEMTICGADHPARLPGASTGNTIMLDKDLLWMGTGTDERPTPMATESILLEDYAILDRVFENDADLLAFLNAAKELNGGLVTLILWTSTMDNNMWAYIASKENTEGLLAPTLNITTAVPVDSSALNIAITSPEHDTSFGDLSPITVTADVGGETDTLNAALVRFYLNGQPVADVTEAPFETTLQDIQLGKYRLSAMVEDSGGKRAFSDAADIYVGGGAARYERLAAVQDTYIEVGSEQNRIPSTNIYGSAETLKARRYEPRSTSWFDGSAEVTYLEFDLSAYEGRRITEAALSVRALGSESYGMYQNSGDYYLSAYGLLPQVWDENSISGAEHPARLEGAADNNIYFDLETLWLNSGAVTSPDPMAASTINMPTAFTDDVYEFKLFEGSSDLLEFLNWAKDFNGGKVTLVVWCPQNVARGYLTMASSRHPEVNGPELLLTSYEAPLSVTINSPKTGAPFLEGADINITATASGGGAVIERVEFYANGEKIGEDSEAPYAYSWTTASAGEHTLQTKVITAAGGESASTTVMIQVVSTEGGVAISNPYDQVDWTAGLCMGNFHTHSTQSDGTQPVDTVLQGYANYGYKVLAMTDHNKVVYPWSNYQTTASTYGMVDVIGNELSSGHHTVSLFCDFASTSGNQDVLLQGVADAGGISFIAHPGRYSYSAEWYADYYTRYPTCFGMEVYNQGDRYPNDRNLWDEVLGILMPGRPVWALSNDDSHQYAHIGRNRTYFFTENPDHDQVRADLEAGRFFATYSSSAEDQPPLLAGVEIDADGTITLSAVRYSEIVWISGGEQVASGESINVFTTPGISGYVRVEMYGDGGLTLLNPFAVAFGGNQAPHIVMDETASVMLGSTLQISPAVSDDGLPNDTLTFRWEQVSGPASAVIADAAAEAAVVSFPAEGEYVLRLSVSDGELSSSADITVTVTEALSGWAAYNDCSGGGLSTGNTTLIGLNQTGSLLDDATGADTGISLQMVNGGANSAGTGGPMTASGTEAYEVFNGKVDFTKAIWYGSTGWTVDAVISGLNPDHAYEFVTTANRGDSSYTDRWTKYTLSGVDSAEQASTAGVTVNSDLSVSFCTGYNTANGYVARWTQIRPGADGTFTVRAENDAALGNSYKAYAFAGIMLRDLGPVSGGGSSFEDWLNDLADKIGDPSKAGPHHDASGNGIANILEYFFGTDPTDPHSRPGMKPVVEPGSDFRARYTKGKDRGDVDASFTWSRNMTDWYGSGESDGSVTVTFDHVVVSDPDEDPETVELVTELAGDEDPGALFLKLEVK